MTIVSAEISQDRIALRTPFVTALRRVEYAEFILLALHTDDGHVAYGSAPATEAITGETLSSIEKALATAIVPALLHRPFDLDELVRTTALHQNSSAKAAAEMALFALAAAARDIPLYRLLGAAAAPVLRTAVTVSLNRPDAMQSAARRYVSEGCDILKIKVGANDGYDARRIRKIARAVPDTTLLVDANQAWDVAAAMAVIDAIADLPIALIEQPVPAHDIASLKEVNDRSPFPILADEAVFGAEDAKKVLDTGAAELINIKLMKSGGIAGALEIIDVCRTYGKRCMLGSMLEGPVSITAALHLAAAYPDMFPWIDLDSPLLYHTLPSDLAFGVQANHYVL